MYINPFLAGVLATVGGELLLLFLCSVAIVIKRSRHGH